MNFANRTFHYIPVGMRLSIARDLFDCIAMIVNVDPELRSNNSSLTVRLVAMFLNRVSPANRRNWTIIEVRAGSIKWAIKCLRPYFLVIPFVIESNHQALERLVKIGEHYPRVQRWMKFVSADQFHL